MLPKAFLAWAARLRLPWLTGVVAFLFFADLIIPDLIPVADELALALATVLLARWKKERTVGDNLDEGEIIDVEEVPPPL